VRRILLLFILLLPNAIGWSQNQAIIRSIANRLPSYNLSQKIYGLDSIVMEYRTVQPALALSYAHEGLKYALMANDSSNQAYYHTLIGVLHKDLADIDSAVIYYNHAIAIQINTNFMRGVAGNYNNLATVYKIAGKFPLSLEHYRKALAILRDTFNDEKNTHIIYQNMAELYVENGHTQLAWDILKEEEQYHTRKNNQSGIAHVNLSKALLLQKDSASVAIPFAEKAAGIYLGLNRIKEYCDVLILRGQLYFATGNEGKGFADLNDAIDKSRKNNFRKQEADGLLASAILYKKNNDLSATRDHLQQATAIYEELKTPMPLLSCYKLLAETEDALGRHQLAYRYFTRFDQLNDSMNNIRLKNDFNQLQIKYNVSEKERQINRLQDSTQIQQLQNEQQQLALEKQRNRNIFLLALVVVILLFSILFIARYIQKQRLSKKLQKALTERDILLKEVHHRVKNNLQIINSLLNLQQEMGGQQTAADIIRLTQDRIQTMSVIHERLYKSQDLENISLEEYIGSLCEYYRQSYDLNRKQITIDTQFNSATPVSIDQLITLGLILNEALINTIKYAFDGQPGHVSIRSEAEKEIITFTIADNGKGLPPGLVAKKSGSLGMQLIEGLAMQLKARLTINGDNGTVISLTFKPAAAHDGKDTDRGR
jgi:two-component system, sensor histidine kinase PdtaS